MAGFFALTECKSNHNEELDFETLKMIDTIVRNEIKLLTIELDSLCEQKMDSLIGLAMDSIKDLRIEEILEILRDQNTYD